MLVEVVAKEEAPADRLVPSWEPSPSADVAGYLVYRNGRLANAAAIVVGDMRGFLVPGTSHADDGLPDGRALLPRGGRGRGRQRVRCRRTRSAASLDNRAPRALVVHPPTGPASATRCAVVADTPDLDVAASGSSAGSPAKRSGCERPAGVDPGPADPPWEATLDPGRRQHFVPGAYELRAVATDRPANTDPDPAQRSRSTYGDTTPARARRPRRAGGRAGRGARLDAGRRAPTSRPTAVPRRRADRARTSTEPRHVDPGLAPRHLRVRVTAVDEEGNESAPSAPAEAVVYALRLDEPGWPVVSRLFRLGERRRFPARRRRCRSSARARAIAEGAGNRRRRSGWTACRWLADGNLLRARGEDADGNRSIPSNEIVADREHARRPRSPA